MEKRGIDESEERKKGKLSLTLLAFLRPSSGGALLPSISSPLFFIRSFHSFAVFDYSISFSLSSSSRAAMSSSSSGRDKEVRQSSGIHRSGETRRKKAKKRN